MDDMYVYIVMYCARHLYPITYIEEYKNAFLIYIID